MNFARALPPTAEAATPLVAPDVFIDGRPAPALSVASITERGPAAHRAMVVAVPPLEGGDVSAVALRGDALVGRRVAALWPADLGDREGGYLPLFDGVIVGRDETVGGSASGVALEAACRWSIALARPLRRAVPAGPLSEVVGALSEGAGVQLSIDGLTPEVGRRDVEGASAGRVVGDALEALCEELGLYVRRDAAWDGSAIVERFGLMTTARRRSVRLGIDRDPAFGGVATVSAASPPPFPLALRVEAEGEVVESTFTLRPAWDRSLEGEPVDRYAKSTSPDFAAFGDVFRLWVLNEDGGLVGAPYDLTALFGASRPVPPTPLRFGDLLTHDGRGQRIGPFIEYTTDGGGTWRLFPGAARVLEGSAGVYLDSDALPEGFIDAARGGQASVRVTATLRSPLPLEAERRVGNPFAGAFERRVFRVGSRFRRRRVLPGSRFYADVAAGWRGADVADDRAAMEAWLLERSERRRSGEGRATVRTASIQPAVRTGDRVTLDGRGSGVVPDDAGPGGSNLAVHRVAHDWARARTTLELRTSEAQA